MGDGMNENDAVQPRPVVSPAAHDDLPDEAVDPRLPEITDAVLDQWEASATEDAAAGQVWSVNPLAVLAVVAEVRRLRNSSLRASIEAQVREKVAREYDRRADECHAKAAQERRAGFTPGYVTETQSRADAYRSAAEIARGES